MSGDRPRGMVFYLQGEAHRAAARIEKPLEAVTQNVTISSRSKSKRPTPRCRPLNLLARPERFELPTAWFVARYSIQLSYGRILSGLGIIQKSAWVSFDTAVREIIRADGPHHCTAGVLRDFQSLVEPLY